jgi:hypothetical protein
MGMDLELARAKAGRARRKHSATVVFQKIHKGLYISHEWGIDWSALTDYSHFRNYCGAIRQLTA